MVVLRSRSFYTWLRMINAFVPSVSRLRPCLPRMYYLNFQARSLQSIQGFRQFLRDLGKCILPSSCCFSNFFPSFKNNFPRVALRFSRPRTERRGRSGKSPPPPLEARSRRHSIFPPPSVLRSPWRRPAARREGRSHSLGLLLTACLPRLL